MLDTGINYTHEDIKDNYKGGVNLVEYSDPSQNPGPIDDSYNSHGTHVAGIIAAEKNGIGVVGVAPNSSLYSVKVLDGSGFGNLSWIISGIQWAMDNNMSIISMSIEGPYSHALQDACDNAYNSGILLVAAAGNTNGGSVAYPAGYDSVIAVTATNATDYNASFDPIDPKIELAAPGVNIYSTINGGYGYLSGTSMAAPHVTGVAALILSSNFSDVNGDGTKNNKDVRELLHKAKHLGVPGRNNIYGYGLVDVPMALGLSDDGGNFKGILGMTYNDSNRNGKKDPDEVGLANWMIRLLGYDTLTKTPVNRLAVTDANGNYSFTNVTPGSYMVCENFQPNWIPNTSACVWVNLSKDESKIVNFGNVRIWSIPPSFRGLRYQNGT